MAYRRRRRGKRRSKKRRSKKAWIKVKRGGYRL